METRGDRRYAAVMSLLIGGVYASSFFLPAAQLRDSPGVHPVATDVLLGHEAFAEALTGGVFMPMWLANPALWVGVGLLLAGRRKGAALAGLIALLLGVSEWAFPGLLFFVGYYVWLSSMALLAAGAWLDSRT